MTKNLPDKIICKEHNVNCKFIPPPRIDKKRNKYIDDFSCPMGHIVTIEFELG